MDFSAQSAGALRSAHNLAGRWGSHLTVLYVVDPMLASASAVAFSGESLVDRTASELHDFVHDSLGRVDTARVAWDARVGRGTDEILKTVARVKADAIVMGTQGMTGVSRWTLGSTTRGVLQRTPVPVLAIPRDDEGTFVIDEAWPGGRIVAALDLNAKSARAAAEAAEVARWFNARLILAHVVEDVRVPPWMQDALTAHDRIRMGKANVTLAAIARETAVLYPDVEPKVLSGHAADEIAALVVTEHAGLIITALEKGGGFFGPRRGSISYHVLTYATAPVLALPRP